MRVIFWLTGILLSLRALYAATMLVLASLHLLGLIQLPGMLGGFVSNLSAPLFVLWAVYVIGYVVAALLTLRRRRLAAPVFLAAFTIDLALWIYSSTVVLYQASYAGRASSIDMIFNVIDVIIAACLVYLWRNRALR